MGAPGSGDLSHQQTVFCLEYLKDFNGTRAAIEAGYAKRSAAAQASSLLNRPHIQAEIKRRLERVLQKVEVTIEDVVSEYARIAFVDLKDAYDDNGQLLHPKDMPENIRRAISGVDVLEEFEGTGREREQIGFTKKLRTWDKLKALEALGRYVGMLTDANDPNKPKGRDININIGGAQLDIDKLTDEDAAEYHATLLRLRERAGSGVHTN